MPKHCATFFFLMLKLCYFKPKRSEILIPVITFSEEKGKHWRQERGWDASMCLLMRSLQDPWAKGALVLGYHFLISSVIQLSFLVSACYILKFIKTFIKPVCSKSIQAEVISTLSFHLCRQDKLMLEHVLRPVGGPQGNGTVCGPGCHHTLEPHPSGPSPQTWDCRGGT